MSNMRVLATVGGAAVALILGTAVAGEHGSVTILKQNATYVPPTDGPAMYQLYCASCHGFDGRGHGPALGGLKEHPADLSQLTARSDGDFPAQHVRYVLFDAGPTSAHATDMPTWSVVLAELDRENSGTHMLRVRNLSDHLKSLQEPVVVAGK